ncbi:MAG: glycosyltransferase family 39 protein [Anaerolineales bacterium]|nr:glycosyltransferase family 39 protein [Anaerolineales bacterium]MDW8227744.1 glycosyltransferase family 39 protein [Anaerolineales bacterium]
MSSKNDKPLALLLLVLAGVFGLYARLAAPAQAGFPILDGGLFYSMATDLIENGLRRPFVASYNNLAIPYAYPPLGIFLTALLAHLTGWDLLQIVRWLPAFFSLLTLPLFYLLAREMLESPAQAALATLLYATLPRAYEWLVMGGGISRAPGTLFYLAFAWAAYRAFAHRDWRMSAWAALFGGLTLLTHPERALHAATTGALFWLWLDRSKSGVLRALIIGGGSLLVSTPWWSVVLARYGAGTLFLASQAGGPRWLFWAPLLQLDFTDESVPLTALLAAFGMFLAWKNGQRLLTLWFILTFLTDPRSAPHIVGVQTCLLAALALSKSLFPALTGEQPWETLLASRRGKIFFGYLIAILIFNVQSNLLTLQQRYVLPPVDRQAIAWVAAQTAPKSRFLALGWEKIPGFSPLLEWFPALSERTNIATIQGREWLPGKANFNLRVRTFPDLYACLDQTIACLEDWATQHQETFEYIYLSLHVPNGSPRLSRLSDSLRASPDYRLVYETSEVLIFQRIP